MAKASIYKEDGRANNGGNHNPKGINQHSENGQSGQSRSILVNSVKDGQILSETETETETRNGNKKQETEKYGELGYVRLTPEQYNTLKTKYPNFESAVEVLDTWLGTTGSKHRNKNHFAYFKSNSWVWERVSGDSEKKNVIELNQPKEMSKEERFKLFMDRCEGRAV